ncbi:MAG: hypothetical protein D6722_02185 [Bacteroidetes bacterium]|nr:MAG: hypothetical protein D6722_02185 [Bacteroidota bacterium]
MKRFFLLTLATLLLGPGMLLAQSGSIPPVLLGNAVRHLPANVSEFVRQPNVQPGEILDGRIFRLVQFDHLLLTAERRSLEAAGWEILQYIPHQAYLVRLPIQDLSQLPSRGVHSVIKPGPQEKMAWPLQAGDYPDHAWRADRLGIVIGYLPGVSPATVAKAVRNLGGEVEDQPNRGAQLTALLYPRQLTTVADLPFVTYMETVPPPPEPEDLRSVSLQRSNLINNQLSGGYRYDGSGVHVAVRDDGDIGPHIDFQGRLSQQFASPGGGTHGDQVASTLGGYGNLDPTVQGMAPGSRIYAMDYDASFLDSTIWLHLTEDVVITNSSYSNGCNAGYTITTYVVDDQAYTYPSLLHVFSAGNSNGSNCGYYNGSDFGNITGGHKVGKNVIATAALNADGSVASFSSRGPARDGRLKPELAAMGAGVRMALPDNTYGSASGTSFSAPALAGISAQLYHAYREFNTLKDPKAGLIKAIMMNTAEDLLNPGPDFETGYGLVHAGRALEVMEQEQYIEDEIEHGQTRTHTITVPANATEVRVMLYWTDPPAWPLANKALINDLDLSLTPAGAGTPLLPWVLDHSPNAAALSAPAIRAVDTLNNVEQVSLTNAPAGTYQITVQGSEVAEGPQEYFIVYSYLIDEVTVTYPMGGESLTPGITERIRWDAYGSNGTFTVAYSPDNGNSWTPLANSLPADTRHYDWGVPADVTGQALIRVTRNAQVAQSQAFHIIGQPLNLVVDQVCPDSTTFSWTPVTGAAGYDVFVMGETYMDSVTTVIGSSSATIALSEDDSHWLSVRARGPNGERGRRAIALFRPAGRFNCDVPGDITALNASLSGDLPLQACRTYVRQVRVTLRNLSAASLSNIPLFYQVDTLPVQSATFSGTISPGNDVIFSFPTPLLINGETAVPVKVWAALPGDPVQDNDTATFDLVVEPGSALSLPYTQDFEAYDLCSTASSCEGEVCALGDGWVNLPNGIADDIDWRTNQGPTPTGSSGPTTDHRPGTATGKYLYLEASGGCTEAEAALVTPCFDLNSVAMPELSFWYHMRGSDMGSLHLDINIAGNWVEDIVPPISGDQGSSWLQRKVDLSDYIGLTVSFRFRGETGSDFASDLALDDISLYDRVGRPVADFSVSRQRVCVDQPLILTDMSFNNNLTREWQFFPDQATYVGGNPNSEIPTVSFSTPGTYAVQLVAISPFGRDTLLRTGYIEVVTGLAPDLAEDFETSAFPPVNWEQENPDFNLTWQRWPTLGPNGSVTAVAFMDNFTYNQNGSEDYLISWKVNLEVSDQPWLYFDVAHARYNASLQDRLRVEVSTNCGDTYASTVYDRQGSSLATAPDQLFPWAPQVASHWRRDSVDLSAFVGQTITLRFASRTATGNNLYLDNIQLLERGQAAPLADFGLSAEEVCEGEWLTLTPQVSAGAATGYQWDFDGANPGTATTAGPHSIQFDSPGYKYITLTASNAAGSTSMTRFVHVKPKADPDFGIVWNGGSSYTFVDSTVGADSIRWDFGDGTTSTDSMPTHVYDVNGDYNVLLIAYNDCGADTAIIDMAVTQVSIDPSDPVRIRAYPNPGDGLLTLEVEAPEARVWQGEILDLQGRRVQALSLPGRSARFAQVLDLRDLSRGVYVLHLFTEGRSHSIRLQLE